MLSSLTKFCELYEAIDDAYGITVNAQIDYLIDRYNRVRSSTLYVKWHQKSDEALDWVQNTIAFMRDYPRYAQYEKILFDQLVRLGRWYLDLCVPFCAAQERWDWWHDPVTGEPIPWRNSVFWPDGEFDPEYAPSPDVVADMKSRFSPGDWQPDFSKYPLCRLPMNSMMVSSKL